MTVKERIQQDRIAALKAGDKPRKAILDYILGQVQTKEKDAKPAPDLAESLIAAYIKSAKEEIANGSPKAPEFEAEIAVLQEYLPKPLTEAEIRAEIEALAAGGANKKGLVFKALKEKHGLAVDGKIAGAICDELGIK